MSYFAAGYRAASSDINEMETCFIEAVPAKLRKDYQKTKGNVIFLSRYGVKKPISDLLFEDKETGSWLALLGTPLINLASEEKKAAFLERFFSDPKRILTDELDGCFALLSYNASTDTFYAATDYTNTTPVFYAITHKGIYLSSHELPLARFLRAEIDPLGFSMTIHLKLTWGSHTRFKNIQKLLPCQIVTFQGIDKCSSEQYWRPFDERQWASNFDDVVNKWLSLLKDSVQDFYSCSTNKTVICEITGGEDARLLLSQCHALGIPFFATVDGISSDSDVRVSKEASQKAGFDLVVRPKHLITQDQLLKNAIGISLMNDAYEGYFTSCTAYATDMATPPKDYEYVKFCGAPGGEVFRGSYYLRGKALFPSSTGNFDYRFFTRMKFLLDFYPGLLRFPDEDCIKEIFTLVEKALDEVREFPVGIRIDHLLNLFQTCNTGLIYKNPRYLPYATKRMTRSIYDIPPHFKRGGRLTKACTEILFPELAIVKTQKGIPTVRRTLRRTFLFMPEYLTMAKFIISGAVSRLYKWTDSNKASYKWDRNSAAINVLLNKPPFGNWFLSSKSMLTGFLYNSDVIDAILGDARERSSKYVPILGRIINQELACRWVYRDLPPD